MSVGLSSPDAHHRMAENNSSSCSDPWSPRSNAVVQLSREHAHRLVGTVLRFHHLVGKDDSLLQRSFAITLDNQVHDGKQVTDVDIAAAIGVWQATRMNDG